MSNTLHKKRENLIKTIDIIVYTILRTEPNAARLKQI